MLQDELMPIEALPEAYLDRAMYFGDGVYEVLRSYRGLIFALDAHLERFANSLQAVDIDGIDLQTVRMRVLRAFNEAKISDAKIYFHVTRGSASRDRMDDTTELTPNFFLTVTELGYASREKAEGVRVITYPDLRWKRCDIKSLNLLPNVLARREAVKQGCSEAVLVNDKGLITEGAASSFFAVIKETECVTLRTSPLTANILPSVTRAYVLKAADILGLRIIEDSIEAHQATQAAELFLAVTTKDILPIVQFNGQPIGSGRPGQITQRLMKTFQRFIA